jgi:hypothetical protein
VLRPVRGTEAPRPGGASVGGVGSVWLPTEWLNGFCNDRVLKGHRRTFSPFCRGVVAAYALEVGAAREGDNWDSSFSAFGAVRYSIHGRILPNFFTRNSELKILFPFEPRGLIHINTQSVWPTERPS